MKNMYKLYLDKSEALFANTSKKCLVEELNGKTRC